MPWARFDELFPGHRKVRRLSDAAFRLQASAVCWSCRYLTDGHIAEDDLPDVADIRKPTQAAEELVRKGLWHLPEHDCPSEFCWPHPDGWLIHDFLDYNPSKQDVETKRAADAERKRKGRTSESRQRPRGHTADSNGTRTGVHAESVRTDPTPEVSYETSSTRPDPISAFVPTANAQALVGEWIDHCPSRPPGRVVGQVAKLVGEMLDEGQDYELVRRGLAAWHERDQHPSTLPSFVFNSGKPSAGSPNKATERLNQGLAVVRRLEAQARGELA